MMTARRRGIWPIAGLAKTYGGRSWAEEEYGFEMRVEKRDGYRVVIGGPVPPQADAITLGNTIVVRKRAANHAGLMAHELVHVRQFKELGALTFMVKYVGSYLRFRLGGYGHMAAYRRIPLEVEASWLSRLHPVKELEPKASVLRSRLARQTRRRAVFAPGPAPLRGTWNRSRRLPDLDLVQAAMASRSSSEETSDERNRITPPRS